MAVDFVCWFCREVVDVTSGNALMHRSTHEWQHRDCCAPAIYASGGFPRKTRTLPDDYLSIGPFDGPGLKRINRSATGSTRNRQTTVPPNTLPHDRREHR